MSTLVRIAKNTEKDLVHRLDQFYLYEFSPFIPDQYKVANDGLFHDVDYLEFWEHPNKHPYLIYHHSEIAGFALVDDLGTHFLMSQFFVMLKFQGTGVAKAAAFDIYASGKFDKSVQGPKNVLHEYSFINAAA